MSSRCLKIIAVSMLIGLILAPKTSAAPMQNIDIITHSDCAVFLSQKDRMTLKTYITCRAIKEGIDHVRAEWIGAHESQYDEKRIGDEHYICPKTRKKSPSYGLWQISQCYHPEVSQEDALDAEKSTTWALDKIRKRPEEWSSWKFRKKWYKDAI